MTGHLTRALLLGAGIGACAQGASRVDTGAQAGGERYVMEVGPQRVACTGERPRRCLRVRVPPDTTWRLFYATIEGFAFEEGYRWRLEVERRRVPDPPADASSVAYRLVRVVSKDEQRP